MCLYPTQAGMDKVKKELNKNSSIVCYKLFKFDKDGKLKNYTMGGRPKIDKGGFIRSNKKSLAFKRYADGYGRLGEIHKGIHVYLHKNRAYDDGSIRSVMVPVICYKEDFVGASESQAVFIKVQIADVDKLHKDLEKKFFKSKVKETKNLILDYKENLAYLHTDKQELEKDIKPTLDTIKSYEKSIERDKARIQELEDLLYDTTYQQKMGRRLVPSIS